MKEVDVLSLNAFEQTRYIKPLVLSPLCCLPKTRKWFWLKLIVKNVWPASNLKTFSLWTVGSSAPSEVLIRWSSCFESSSWDTLTIKSSSILFHTGQSVGLTLINSCALKLFRVVRLLTEYNTSAWSHRSHRPVIDHCLIFRPVDAILTHLAEFSHAQACVEVCSRSGGESLYLVSVLS